MDQNKKTYSRENLFRSKIEGYHAKVMSSYEKPRPIPLVVSDSSESEDELVQVPLEMSKSISDKEKRIYYSPSHSPKSNITTQPIPDAEKRALESLTATSMLNDIIIDKYINHILKNMKLSLRERIHVFSNFFFSKLKRINTLSQVEVQKLVRRWDKHVKLFEKDYLVLPICDRAHWTLLIICFPHKILPDSEEVIVIGPSTHSSDAPCILIFDSLGYKYMTRFTDPVRGFLTARWQYERPVEGRRDFQDRFKFPEINVRVPRQRNSFDCGVYLLDSFERFFKDPLLNYCRIREGKDLSYEWMLNGMEKRQKIRRILSNPH